MYVFCVHLQRLALKKEVGCVASNPDITRYINFRQTHCHPAAALVRTGRRDPRARRGRDKQNALGEILQRCSFTRWGACTSGGEGRGQQSRQLCSTMAETLFSYSRLFSWYSCAAWLFAGLLGFGSSSKDCIEVKIDETSYVGLQRF